MEIGLIGLGVMGHSLALNIVSRGHKLHVFNRTSSKTEALARGREGVHAHYSIKDLVEGINASPRIILLMLTSGDVIDRFLEELSRYLGEDDVVIDGGNSSYKDTIRRNRYRFGFVGCGISGGEEGARNGPSIVVGCSKDSWEKVGEFLSGISAASPSTGQPCCAWLGEGGAGHFVKMAHNGIEYADMGIISETYLALRTLGLTNREIAEVFDGWEKEESESYLLRISCSILKTENKRGSFVDQIEDASQQKGTGRETVVSSMEMGTPATAIMEAVAARMVSHAKEKRKWLSKRMETHEEVKEKLPVEEVRGAFYLARVVSYVQGINLLMEAGRKHGWGYGIKDISRVWSNGCILRGKLLGVVESMGEERSGDFELTERFVSLCNKHLGELKRMVLYCVEREVPVPTISSCLMYLNGMKKEPGAGAMIQAMRDYFGAHGVVMRGETEMVHAEWRDAWRGD